MNYFNQTEEVLEIKLTPYGKALYSVGKFNPKYYSFSDEGVVYNVSGITGSSGYLSEEQNETNGRIINDTPYLKISNRNIHTSEDNIRSQTTSPISTSPNDPNVSTIFNQVILGQDPDMVEKLIIDKNWSKRQYQTHQRTNRNCRRQKEEKKDYQNSEDFKTR